MNRKVYDVDDYTILDDREHIERSVKYSIPFFLWQLMDIMKCLFVLCVDTSLTKRIVIIRNTLYTSTMPFSTRKDMVHGEIH